MRKSILILIGVLAVIAGLALGAVLGVIFVGLAIGLAGSALVGLIGWGAGRAAHRQLTDGR